MNKRELLIEQGTSKNPLFPEMLQNWRSEYCKLAHGEQSSVVALVSYPCYSDSPPDISPNLNVEIQVEFIWDSDTTGEFTIIDVNSPETIMWPEDICEFIVENSMEFAAFNYRIHKLIEEVEKASMELFDDKDKLWNEYFEDLVP